MVMINIRQEVSADYDVVHEILLDAFKQSEEADLVRALRNSNAFISSLSLVALLDNEIVGHILFTKINIDALVRTLHSLALAPMAVKSEYQNQKIGNALIEHGLLVAKMQGWPSVIVVGHKDYYPKFGFTRADKWKIRMPFEADSEHVMALELQPDALEDAEDGMVIYAKEFGLNE
jgi:putative acetyltransferase